MSVFKVKDLIINMTPADEKMEYAGPLPFCYRPDSCMMIMSDCHRFNTWCGGFRTVDDPCLVFRSDWCLPIQTTQVFIEQLECAGGTILPEIDFLKIDPREFAMVREHLMVAVKGLKAGEQLVAEGMAPKTLEEVDLLRVKLQEAMVELDAMAKGMR